MNSHIIYGLFQGSKIVSFLDSLTKSQATMQSRSGVLGKWSECVVQAVISGGELSSVHKDSPKGKAVQSEEMQMSWQLSGLLQLHTVNSMLVCIWDVCLQQTVISYISFWLTDLTEQLLGVFKLFVI